MRDGEYKITDTRGRFLQAVRDGREVNDAAWANGRILLSNQRLVLAGTSGQRTVPLPKIREVGGRFDVNQNVATVADYVALHAPSGVVLVAPAEFDEFERDLYGALLHDTSFLARHPAVAGGVVQNTEWESARVKVEDEAVSVATVGGTFAEILLDDIGDIVTGERTVVGENRTVVEVEHSDDGTSVQTYLSGPSRAVSILRTLFRKGEEQSDVSIELSQTDKQVLTALYSGVEPFDIPAFLGLDVDEVETLFERLIDHNVVDEVRIRREVELTARGRSIASDVIGDQ